MAIKVGVVGAAGYAGVELVRLLISHPDFELTAITSNADAGQSLASVYPAFAGVCDLAFTTHDDPVLTWPSCCGRLGIRPFGRLPSFRPRCL